MSLRRRLLLLTVVVVAVALVVADVAAYVALRSFLVAGVEQGLVDAASASPKLFQEPDLDAASAAGILKSGNPNAAYALYDPQGTLLAQAAAMGNDGVGLPPPVMPEVASVPRVPLTQGVAPTAGDAFMVPARSGGFDYVAIGVAAKSGSLLVVAFPLAGVAATLRQLAVIELVVTLAVVGLFAVVATRLIGVALRPLAGIEVTAGRIAGGEIGLRIAPVDPATEVGRLGLALNTMLARIESALAAREASEQRLRSLVTDASHELRTPLTSLRGYAELFRRGAGERPDDLARAMRGIELESERMTELVDELLLLARLDEGQPLPAADEDLVPVVRAAVEAARVVESDRPLEVRVPAVALVRADAARMRQVVDNLLANVRVHTPPGTPATVSVRVERAGVILEVADAGPGMTEPAKAHAFERFFRADPSRSRDSGGSGLGLAIVAAIARAYGGEVAVQSAPGMGTTFTVTWPAARTDDSPGPQGAAARA